MAAAAKGYRSVAINNSMNIDHTALYFESECMSYITVLNLIYSVISNENRL